MESKYVAWQNQKPSRSTDYNGRISKSQVNLFSFLFKTSGEDSVTFFRKIIKYFNNDHLARIVLRWFKHQMGGWAKWPLRSLPTLSFYDSDFKNLSHFLRSPEGISQPSLVTHSMLNNTKDSISSYLCLDCKIILMLVFHLMSLLCFPHYWKSYLENVIVERSILHLEKFPCQNVLDM